MMYYHGTARERGKKAIDEQVMPISQGDEHWLGDGVYFYTNFQYAYRWIWMMCEKRIQKNPPEGILLDNYMVIVAEISCPEDRIFDLANNPEHFLLFEDLRKTIMDKQTDDPRLSKKIVDGVILNILFNDYNFGENFDAVQYNFSTKKATSDTRIVIPEIQVCVKNPQVITEIKECTNYDYNRSIQFIYSYNDYKKGDNHNDTRRKSKTYQKFLRTNG